MEIDEIYQSMKASVEDGSGVYINNGGDMALRLYAVAAELYSLWTQADWLQRQSFPQTATGELLDRHAQLRSLERRAGTCAEGELCFAISETRESEIGVPAGTVCLNSAGVEFITLAGGAIAPGETVCTVRAKAREAGRFGNAPAESIYQMALAPIGVARCYNPAAFSGGTDPETDETLRKRIMDSYARLPNGSNASYYEAEALNTDGVAAAKVIPRARGLGTVDVIVAAAGGSPPPELIAALQEKFAKEREICVDVRVASPVLVPVNISVVVEVEEGSEAKAVCANVAQELGALFDGRLLGRNLNLARIGNVVYGVPGVLNYTISSPGADVSIATNELPVSGSITVTRR